MEEVRLRSLDELLDAPVPYVVNEGEVEEGLAREAFILRWDAFDRNAIDGVHFRLCPVVLTEVVYLMSLLGQEVQDAPERTSPGYCDQRIIPIRSLS